MAAKKPDPTQIAEGLLLAGAVALGFAGWDTARIVRRVQLAADKATRLREHIAAAVGADSGDDDDDDDEGDHAPEPN